MSGRMSAWLEPPRPAEPGRPRRGRGLGALASQADDDPVPLVQVAAQYLDVLVVADPGLHLDAPERAVRRADVDGSLLLRHPVPRGRPGAARPEAGRARRAAEELVRRGRPECGR